MGTDRKRPTTEQAEARLLADITGAKDADGGPAFPNTTFWRAGGLEEGVSTGGMSLRDYFAAKALSGIIVATQLSEGFATTEDFGCDRGAENQYDTIGRDAYAIADAMLAARNPTT